MNLKYYLRGLGAGIFVTALIMGIAADGKEKPLSDSEIIERAKELGMTQEGTLLSDMAEEGLPTDEEMTSEDEGGGDKEQQPAEAAAPTSSLEAAAESALSPAPLADDIPTASPTPAAADIPTASPTPAVTPAPAEEDTQEMEGITIQINSGDGSFTVCKKLEETGLIASASDFDTYLCENGYDKRLNVGTYLIPEGAEPEEIAKILARQK